MPYARAVEGALEEYLSSLPTGLGSFPEARCKGDILDEQLEWLDEAGVGLAPELEEPVRKARPFGKPAPWVPEVLINAISLDVRRAYPSDEVWIDTLYQRQCRLYRRPINRALLLVMSPTLLTMAASERWGAYRQGSTLAVDRWKREGSSRSTVGTLYYPAGLHTPLLLRGLAQTLRSAIDAAGARGSSIELVESESTPGEARYALSYD